MNKLTRNIVAFLVTFLAVQLCAMYILGGFDQQTVETKFLSSFVGVSLGAAILTFLYENK